MLEGLIVSRMDEAEMAEAATTPIPAARGGARRGRGAGGGRARRARRRAEPGGADPAVLKAEGVVAVFNRGSDSLTASAGSDLTSSSSAPTAAPSFRPAAARARRIPPTGAADGDARGRALQPHGPHARQGRPGEGGAEHRDEVPRRDRRRTASTSSPRSPAPIPALKDEVVLLGAHFDSVAAVDRRHRQRHRIGRDDGGDADPEGGRRQAAPHDPHRALGRGRAGAARVRAPTSREHFADPATMQLKPEHAKISAYFNSDNGTGKIRGVWLQGNLAVRPIFADAGSSR